MTPKDFLRAVWPTTGYYCLAHPFAAGGDPRIHKVFETVADVETYVGANHTKHDMYFAMFSLREKQIFDPDKVDYKTGKRGAIAYRPHKNMLAAKVYWLDVDAGETKHYKTQAEAVAALIAFVAEAKLPVPTVISSGNGLHVYWLVDNPVTQEHWLPTAVQLGQLTEALGLKADSSCTTDVARILRVPGSLNFKDRANPRPVVILKAGPVTPTKDFQRAVSDALTRAGGVPMAVPKFPASLAAGPLGASNLTQEYDGPPADIGDVGKACAQLRAIFRTGGNCDEPAWMHGIIGTTIFMRSDKMDGDQLAHLFSSKHPHYSKAETDAKIDNRRRAANAPTSCRKIAEVSPLGLAGCVGCIHANDPSVPNPLVAARKTAPAAQPVIQQLVAGAPVQVAIPDPPAPYTRLKEGGIARKGKNQDGDDVIEVIYPYDLFPLRRLVDTSNAHEQQVWCVELPREGRKEFLIDAPALYDSRKFTEVISHQGIYPHKAHVPYLQDYMVAYISELQKEADAQAQASHLGWSEDFTQFILPDKILCADGTVKPAALGVGAQRSTEHVGTLGNLADQAALMPFYNRPEYLAHQLFMLAGLAAPMFGMTGHHGMVVNASGEAGSSKSTALYTAMGWWGVPELYAINGTNSGATTRARNERVTVLANLPIGLDEVTHLPAKDTIDLAMGVSQPGHRLRLQTDGIERRSNGGHKATILMTTSNHSLHNVLAMDNTAGTAGSMRVFEIKLRLSGAHEKPEADAFLRQIKMHYGHIGPAFAAYVERRVHAMMKKIDVEAKIKASERYWSAYVAVCIVAGEIAFELGLLPFDMVKLYRHALDVEIPAQRGTVVEQYSTPIAILGDFLETIQGNILTTTKTQFSGRLEPHIKSHPHGALLAHYEMYDRTLFVLKKGFRDYCQKIGASAQSIVDELNKQVPDNTGKTNRVISNKNIRRTLGAGTDYAKTQSWCFVIDMSHPDIADEIDPETLVSTKTVLKAVT
jgi:hypothetical protein